jgi:hypothetical protein
MSKKILVGLRDNVAECFTNFFYEKNSGTAIRAFSESVKDSPHKDDYSIWLLGEVNEQDGSVSSFEPTRIFSGLDVKKETTVIES